MRVALLGAGFIGSALIRAFIAAGDRISVLDRKPAPPDWDLRNTWIQGRFEDRASIEQALEGADVVYHLIASSVPGDEFDRSRELTENVNRTLDLLDVCVSVGARRIVFLSSAAVYGRQYVMPVNEASTTDPISSYGINKLCIEKYLLLYRYEQGLDVKILRLANPYGPGQRLDGRQGFIAIVCGKLLANEPVPLRGDGSAVRDFLHIDDVVAACRCLAHFSSVESVFNIGCGLGVSLSYVLEEFSKLLGYPVPVARLPERKADIPASVLDISRAHREFDFQPRVPLMEGLERLLRHHGLL